MTKPSIDIRIYGRNYTVSCTEPEKSMLLSAVDLLNERMEETHRNTGNTTTERIAVIAALNMAHELLSLKISDGGDVLTLRHRLSAMNQRLDDTLQQTT